MQQSRFFVEGLKGEKRMKIIDFHAHVYPEKISKKAVRSVGEFYGIRMDGEGTTKNMMDIGKKAGVTNWVVCSVAVDGGHVEAINKFITDECKKNGELFGLSAMHADYENKIPELERVFGLGLRGVKIHPDTQKFNMDDDRMFEVYDFLQQTEKPILVHCGDYRYDYSHPRRLKRILELFPKLIVVAAHFGGWSVYDLALEYLKDTSCYLDTSSALSYLGKNRARELIDLYGAERIVFGTDFPMWNAGDELKKINELKLTQNEAELILHKNAERILKIGEEL